MREVVQYYTERGSHVFACFVDLTRAFDMVNYWKLFNKLLDDGVNDAIVALLAYWYSNQEICVRWNSSLSSNFCVSNGTRQGGILSPNLFSPYTVYVISFGRLLGVVLATILVVSSAIY